MKRIRNRKLLQYKRRRYSLLLRSFRMSMLESGQEIADWRDAAEFEARIAAKLANPKWAVCRHGDTCIEYGGDKEDVWIWRCETCRMKWAMIAVEEEMDGLSV